MKKLIKNWLEKIKKGDVEKNFLQRKESILYTLLFEQTTETSLKLFDEVSVEFRRKIDERLTNIKDEKKLIEKWEENLNTK